MRRLFMFLSALGLLLVAGQAQAGAVIWGNNATFQNVTIEAFDGTTGAELDQFLVPNLTARADNGRGVAVLGGTMYYSTANSGNIYVTTANVGGAHPDLGVLVNTGFGGIANIATDGTFLYANDYHAFTNQVNKYTTAGVLVGMVTFTGPDAFADGRDGFEVTNNPKINGGALTFIMNRGDAQGPYDVYDSTGAEIKPSFINPAANGSSGPTGIAFDGTNYYVSDIFNNRLLEYDGDGNFLGIINLGGPPPHTSSGRLLEDLSAVGNTINNPPPSTPEPASMTLLCIGAASMAGYRLRRRKAAAA
jgi:hypothetical protein